MSSPACPCRSVFAALLAVALVFSAVTSAAFSAVFSGADTGLDLDSLAVAHNACNAAAMLMLAAWVCWPVSGPGAPA